jgi:D-amino peptidase
MEGITGIVNPAQVSLGTYEYAFGRRMLMHDLLALVEGLHDAGVDDIVLYDEHATGRNIDVDRMPPYVTVICGKPAYRPEWAGGLDASFSGMILLGLHAKAGTEGAVMPHTYEGAITDLRLNGISVGEIGMEAAIAGDFGVPTLLVVADSAGAAEAQATLPGVHTVAVKQSLAATSACCLSTNLTAQQIRSAAVACLASASHSTPFCLASPVQFEVDLCPGPYLDAARALVPDRMNGDSTIMLKGNNATSVWSEFWEINVCTYARMKSE